MDKIHKIITEIPSFSGLTQSQLEDISKIIVKRNFNKGETIFSDGDDGDGFYFILSGKVKIYKISAEGKEQILHIFGPGEPFGEVPVFSGQSFPANAQAIAKTKVLFFPRKAFVKLIADHPSFAMNMLAVLSMRLRQFTIQIESLSLKEVPARLAAYLIYLSKEQNNQTSLVLKISKGQLASLLGTIPETLSRIFSKMANDGLIKVNGKNIKILDYEGLKFLAEFGKRLGL